ncbi:MAG TPA: hypothetical protein DEA47_04020 [Peptococcaceae bacterium]|nr:MAG: hypothetical protein XD50_0972 [Clostridia bacterium 41_269]HBT20518.1 hypothetical protein [Peptococcaceae bacterium]
MQGYPIGTIVLVIIAAVIYLGLAHRTLDRLYLTDKAALLIIAAMILGSFIDIPITFGGINASVNVGGAVIPLILVLYVLSKAGTSGERIRAVLAAVITAAVIFSINTLIFGDDPWHRGRDFVDPLYVYPLVAGGTAYIAGRSRRSAFIAAFLGVLLLDIIDYLIIVFFNVPGSVNIGGAGVFDALVLSGIVAVGLAEIIGETRERIQGGPAVEGRNEKLLEGLKNKNYSGDRGEDDEK